MRLVVAPGKEEPLSLLGLLSCPDLPASDPLTVAN